MPIPDAQKTVCEIQMQGRSDSGGGDVKNFSFIFHYRRTAIIIPPVKASLDAVFQAGPGVNIVAALNNRYTQMRNTLRWVNDAFDPPVPFAHVPVGGVAGDGLSTLLAVYMLFRSNYRGKSFRGAKHFGPMSEADSTALGDDVLNAAAIARFNTISAALAAPLVDADGNNWVLTILSRALSSIDTNPTVVTTTDVSVILLNTRLGRMKRRQIQSVY